ncbi:hypothetical protein ACFL0D_08050, partial [Thermoproteota archaeon]
MNRKKSNSIKTIFLILTFMVLSVTSIPQPVYCATEIWIGVIAPDGGNEYGGIITIALEDINDYIAAEGLDYELRFVLKDAKGQSTTQLELIQEFNDMRINLLIGGGWLSQDQASLSYINDNDMILFSPNFTTTDLSIPDNLFRLNPSDEWDTLAMDDARAKDVNDRFVTLMGMPLTSITANVYDICWIYASSIFSTDSTDALTIARVLHDIAATYNGITGNCTLDENG